MHPVRRTRFVHCVVDDFPNSKIDLICQAVFQCNVEPDSTAIFRYRRHFSLQLEFIRSSGTGRSR